MRLEYKVFRLAVLASVVLAGTAMARTTTARHDKRGRGTAMWCNCNSSTPLKPTIN